MDRRLWTVSLSANEHVEQGRARILSIAWRVGNEREAINDTVACPAGCWIHANQLNMSQLVLSSIHFWLEHNYEQMYSSTAVDERLELETRIDGKHATYLSLHRGAPRHVGGEEVPHRRR